MEDLTPPLLTALRELRWRISSGRSMKESLRLYLDENTSPFSHHLREWWALKSQDRPTTALAPLFTSHYQKSALLLIERGLAGQPTLDHLCALEDEVELAAAFELEAHLQTLPFKVLIPLLLFQFPAYLILLLGPLLRDLQTQMGG